MPTVRLMKSTQKGVAVFSLKNNLTGGHKPLFWWKSVCLKLSKLCIQCSTTSVLFKAMSLPYGHSIVKANFTRLHTPNSECLFKIFI